MKPFLITTFVALTALIHSCSKSIDLNEGTAELRLKQCATGILNGDDLKLCFDKVVEDSRCPANAMCIWQGAATVKLNFTKNGETHSFNLSSLTMPPTYTKDTIISGYKIEFLNLLPYPGTFTPPASDDQVKLEIKISKN